MTFKDEMDAIAARAVSLPAPFHWNFRNDDKSTLHYGRNNVVIELCAKQREGVVVVHQRPIERRRRSDGAYPPLSPRTTTSLEGLESYLHHVLLPFAWAQAH